MQAAFNMSAGRRASKSAEKLAETHQQGGWAWPVACLRAIAQPFSPPQRGQRLVSRGVVRVSGMGFAV
jgi:hypothetical protein